MKKLLAVVAVSVLALPAVAQQHYSLSSDWVTGEGEYVVVPDGDDNHILSTAALNNADPKHAWVNGDFPNEITLVCDIRIDSWVDGEDLSRAGIAVHIQPDGTAPDGGGDRGINMLVHDASNNVEFLNDLRGWGDDTEFDWDVGTWYTMELTTDGTTVTGSMTERGNPDNTVELAPWDFPDPQNRQGGFPGVTASTLGGLMASFDNFMVMDSAGNVLFQDDFESPGSAISQLKGLNARWEAGQAGYYVAQDGVMYGIATSGADPKHAWFDSEIEGAVSMAADVMLMSWQDGEDLSRAGLAVHIQPDGTAPDGGGDRGINILFHDSFGNIEFLNDLRGWGDDTAFDWTINTWYRVEISSDGTTVTGSATEIDNPDNTVELAAWDFPDPQNRQNGFAGVTPSTLIGLIAAYDNVEVTDGEGNVLFQDDFEGPDGSSSIEADWELFR